MLIKSHPVGNARTKTREEGAGYHDVDKGDKRDRKPAFGGGNAAEQRGPNDLQKMKERIEVGDVFAAFQQFGFPEDRSHEEHDLHYRTDQRWNVAKSR